MDRPDIQLVVNEVYQSLSKSPLSRDGPDIQLVVNEVYQSLSKSPLYPNTMSMDPKAFKCVT